MNLKSLPLFGLMGRRMAWLTQRQLVLSQNIANADTPGYQPRDLSAASFKQMLAPRRSTAEMAQTSAAHLQPIRRPDQFRVEKTKDAYGTTLAGNSVVIEEQLLKVQETKGAHSLVTNLYSKHISMLKAAIGRDR